MVVKRKAKPLLIVIIVFAILLLCSGGILSYLISPVDSSNEEIVEVEIVSGTSTSEIAAILKKEKLIKSETLFKLYVKFNNVNSLKAATYRLNQSMGLGKIIDELEKGSTYNPNVIKLTLKEGETIPIFAKVISENTDNSYDEVIKVFKDMNYMESLVSKFWFLTDEILNPNIYYPLEGYLAPDTYHFDNRSVSVNEIIETMLKEMNSKLTKYEAKIKNNVHSIMTMASIVELEGTNTENRKMIVGVFNNRLKAGMNLGSDVTTYYGLQAAMTSDLTTEQFASVNPYNTRSTTMIGKMPVGPICNPSLSSIEASVNPNNNDYLFFIADKHGEIFYTKTNKEHEKKVKEIKDKGDWIW